ncbi:MAG: PAS domain-containing protein, partial [Spirochaetia bacterium]
MMKEKSRKHDHKPDISLFKDIVNLSSDAVLVLDSGGIIIYANKAAEDLFRSGKHGMAGEKFTYSPVDGNTVELETERDK